MTRCTTLTYLAVAAVLGSCRVQAAKLNDRESVSHRWHTCTTNAGSITVRNTGMTELTSPEGAWWLRCFAQLITRDQGSVSQAWETFWDEIQGRRHANGVSLHGTAHDLDVHIAVRAEQSHWIYTWNSEVRALDPMLRRVEFSLLLQARQLPAACRITVQTHDRRRLHVDLCEPFTTVPNVRVLQLPDPKGIWKVAFQDADHVHLSFHKPGEAILQPRAVGLVEPENHLLFTFTAGPPSRGQPGTPQKR